jgi:hypothetical protein
MAAELGVQGFLLLVHRIVPVLFAPFPDCFSPLPSRLAMVFTCTVNLLCRLRVHMCTKPKKLKVAGFFPCFLAFLAAYRPNSISQQLTHRHQVFLRKPFRVFEQLDDVVNDIVNFAAPNDAPGLEGKYPFNQLLHSFEVHYPIRFPRFTTVG